MERQDPTGRETPSLGSAALTGQSNGLKVTQTVLVFLRAVVHLS